MSDPATLRFRCRDTRPLTVLDVTKWFGETSGGVRTYLTEKGNYVRRNHGLRQVLVVPGESDSMTDYGSVCRYTLKGPRIPTQPQYRFLLATRSLRRIVMFERPHIIEVGSPILVPWVALLAARGLGLPFAGFHHTHFPRGSGGGLVGTACNGMLRSYARILDQRFETTFVASEFARAELEAAGARRLTRVPLGVDLECFNPLRRALSVATRAQFGIPQDVPMVVTAGRIAPEKDLETAIDAWRRLESRTNAVLVIVGEGPLKSALQEVTRGSRIHWLPFQSSREKLANLFAAADAYVSPGSSETFGLSALESLASGTPVVSADAGGVAETVSRSGAGILFPPGNSLVLAECILAILNHPRRIYAQRGREYAIREHSWDTVFDTIFASYRGILDRRAVA